MAAGAQTLTTRSADIGGFSTPGRNRQQHSSISKVRVVVRLRPFLPREISSTDGATHCSCVSLQESEAPSDDVTLILKDQEASRSEFFKLDGFFGHGDNGVSQIFDKELKPLIPGLFQGLNATVFAYGAAGSGKTYTLQGSDKLPGLMTLAMSAISSIYNCTGSRTSISYYEIYLDKCYDLLEPKEKEIAVLNDKDGHIHLRGLVQIEVDSMEKFHEIFSSALQRRKVAHTRLNDESSRSHCVLVINVSSPSHYGSSNPTTGKLNLIDLAGNEDNRMTNNDGIRLHESAKINQSLLALSNVIHALNNCLPRIPYRESKLTRILQDSLGGTSRALMIACLNPGRYQESVHTLGLASRSRHVSNSLDSAHKSSSLNMKVDMEAKLLEWLESKGKMRSVQRLRPHPSPVHSTTPSAKSVHETKCLSNSKQRSMYEAKRDLFKRGDCAEPIQKNEDCDASAVTSDEESDFPANDSGEAIISSPLISVNVKEVASPQRKALSPIDSNVLKPSFDPTTPKMNKLNANNGEDRCLTHAGTPLDKFTASSCRLKNILVDCYIEFLNTASMEELMEMKGIGQKMAEYIIELRETTPLKSLHDIEKIGLSSKQVHILFSKAASGQLEKITLHK